MKSFANNHPSCTLIRMRWHLSILCYCVLVVCLALAHAKPVTSASDASTVAVSRPVTVADAIRMTTLGDPDYYAGKVATFSPDGSTFVVVLRNGNLEDNTIEYSLLLWKTDHLSDSPVPRILLRMSSSSNREGIAAVTWLSDNERIAFLGEHPGEHRQLYVLNTRTSKVRQVTHQATNVLSYSITPRGDQVAYVAEEPVAPLVDEEVKREGVVVRTQQLKDLILGQKRGRFDSNIGQNHLYMLRHGVTTSLASPYGSAGNPPFVSPNGKYIVMLSQVLRFPTDWLEYSDPYLHEWTRVSFEPGQYSAIERYELIDSVTGDAHVLLNSPSSGSRIAWSPDSRSVAIGSTYLPLADTEGIERIERRNDRFLVEVTVPAAEYTTIAEGDFRLLGWNPRTGQLEVADRSDESARVCFTRRMGAWQRVNDEFIERFRPTVGVDEDMNTPPRIVAVDPASHERHALLDLNPQFKALTFAKVEEIQWNNFDGRVKKGGLYYPIHYVPGERYPLVIQTHGWDPRKFWIDGPWTTGFAAQPLAGRDIMVLQTDEEEGKDFDTPREFPRDVSSLESVIDYLDKKGLIDRHRVGLIGFSRSGDVVSYALTHSTFHFVAAAVADGSDQGYFSYLIHANRGVGRELEFTNGGIPFGDGLTSWIANSPEFNLDKIQTPVRLLALGPDILLGAEWGWFAGSVRLNRPIELLYLPDATHVLQKPWERMVAQQGNVDWFCFWLNGDEDPDSAKTPQYTRWRELRNSVVDPVRHKLP